MVTLVNPGAHPVGIQALKAGRISGAGVVHIEG